MANNLVPRTRHSYGLAAWTDFDDSTYLRFRKGCYFSDFTREDGVEGADSDGPVSEFFKTKGFGSLEEVRARKFMAHGRFPTSGEALKIGNAVTAECHPFEYLADNFRFIAMHNGMFEPWEEYAQVLSRDNFPPDGPATDSSTVCAQLFRRVRENGNDPAAAGHALIQDLKNTGSTGALVYSLSSAPGSLFAVRYIMPLVVIRSSVGTFVCSDVSITRGLPDAEFEVYCLRDGAFVEVNSGGIVRESNNLEPRLPHYGRMRLPQGRFPRGSMQPCNATKDGNHDEKDWDKRTTINWAVWPQEKECLHCACRKREDQDGRPLNDTLAAQGNII